MTISELIAGPRNPRKPPVAADGPVFPPRAGEALQHDAVLQRDRRPTASDLDQAILGPGGQFHVLSAPSRPPVHTGTYISSP